jgi:hypothetical protein
MQRRTALMLTGLLLLGSAVGTLPKGGLAQSDPFLGTWQLNLAKSKYSPGPALKSQTVAIQAEGQNHKLTIAGIDAAGKPVATSTITRIYDGMPHPVPGSPDYDTEAATRVDANNLIIIRTKAGKLVQINTMTVSPDAKTRTFIATGIDANGHPLNNATVFDKQ